MTDLNRELDQHTVTDFENTAIKDTSTSSTRDFGDDEEAAITAAAEAARRRKR
jgi:hypothetical protein